MNCTTQVLSQEECVGRLCAQYGVRRADAEALFRKCETKSTGVVELASFRQHYDELCAVVGGEFARRPDQRPVFEFHRGEPVTQPATEKSK